MKWFCNLPACFLQVEVNETRSGDGFMNASERDRCKRCGAVVPARSTESLCPACLMSGALAPSDADAETVSLGSSKALSRLGHSEFPCEFGDYRLLGLLGRGASVHNTRSSPVRVASCGRT